MVRSGHLAAAFVLVLASAFILAESKPAATLGDWLAKSIAEGKAGPSSAAPAYEYGGVEVLETCIQEYAVNNCQGPFENGALLYNYWDSELTCCRHKHDGPEALSPGESLLPTKTGECSYTLFPLNPAVDIITGKTSKVATFLATCQFDKKADECGHPFCDKLTLTVQGDVYDIEDAIISSKPAFPTALGDVCSAAKRKRSAQWGKKRAAKGGQVVAKASYDDEESEYEPHHKHHHDHHEPHYEHDDKPYYEPRYEGPYYEGPEYDYHHNTTLYKAPAVVLYGPMTINSRIHGVKYEQGWFEYVHSYNSEVAVEITKEQAGDAYVLDPFKYKLSFYKEQSYKDKSY